MPGSVAPRVFAVVPTDHAEERGPSGRSGAMTGRALFSLILVGLASMVAQGFGRFTFPVLLDAIDNELLDSYTVAGLLSNVPLVAYLIGVAVVSVASTRVDSVTLVQIGVGGSLAGLTVMALAPTAPVLAGGLFVAGFGAAAVWVPAPGIAASLVGPERGGLAIGLVGSGIGTGIVVAGPLTNVVRAVTEDEGAWRPVYGVQAAVAVVVLAGLLVVLVRGRTAAATDRVPISVITTVPGWALITAAFSIFGVAYSLYFYFLPTQLVESGWSRSASTLIFSVLGLASVFGGIVFGRLSDAWSRPTTMAVGFCLMSAAPLATLLGAAPFVVAGVIGFGLCTAGVPTTIGAMLADRLQGRAFGTAFGTLTFAFGIAQLAGPPFAGWVGDRTGSFRIPFMVASAFALCGAGIGLAMHRVTGRSTGSTGEVAASEDTVDR
jgi:MFS family permease